MFKDSLVLTGSIATGKSTVAKILKEEYGFVIIDADKIAHEIIEKEKENIFKIFGEEAIKNNKVNRSYIGSIIFSNEDKKKELENLLHPLIKKEIIHLANENEKNGHPYILDIPLFFETNNYKELKNVIVVYTTEDRQIQQLMDRNNLTESEAKKRIFSQIPVSEKVLKAKHIINNIGDIKELKKSIESLVFLL